MTARARRPPAGLDLVARHQERDVPGVRSTGGLDRLVHLLLGAVGHAATRVGDDHEPVNAEQVTRQHDRTEHVVGHACTSVPQDLRVPWGQTEHGEGLDP